MPPLHTGVADYSSALLRALRRLGSAEVDADRADVRLYHIGNNSLHAEIYRQALAEPGVVVLHDAVLNHLMLGSLTEQQYRDEFAYNYGEWNRGLAADLWLRRDRSGGAVEYFQYPLLRRIAERSRAVIVHNPAAQKMVLRHAPEAQVAEIPHLFEPPGKTEEIARGRTVTFGVFGYLRETKRVLSVLKAFRAIRTAFSSARLLIAGECVSPEYERTIAPLAIGPGVFRVPWLADDAFHAAIRGVSVCINLRHPSAGETSGIAVRIMGIGRAVMLTDSLENSRIPEPACIRIDSGLAERDLLEQFMAWLCQEPDAAREIGARAAAHVAEHHSIERIAEQYWRVLNNARS